MLEEPAEPEDDGRPGVPSTAGRGRLVPPPGGDRLSVMSDRPRLTVTLEPAAELERRDLAQRVPGFEDAYGELVGILTVRPGRGWPLSGGRWGYALARRGKPRVRVRYTLNETELRIHDVQATPVEDLPGGEGR